MHLQAQLRCFARACRRALKPRFRVLHGVLWACLCGCAWKRVCVRAGSRRTCSRGVGWKCVRVGKQERKARGCGQVCRGAGMQDMLAHANAPPAHGCRRQRALDARRRRRRCSPSTAEALFIAPSPTDLPAGVQAAVLGQRDHVLREGADGLGLDLGGPDLAVADELGHLRGRSCRACFSPARGWGWGDGAPPSQPEVHFGTPSASVHYVCSALPCPARGEAGACACVAGRRRQHPPVRG